MEENDIKTIKKVVNALKDNISESENNYDKQYAVLESSDHAPIKIKKEYFHEIRNKDEGDDKKAAFVDGGNAEVISSPDFSVQMIQVYYCIYHSKKRVKSERMRLYALIYSKKSSSHRGIDYHVRLFGDNKIDLDQSKLVFNSVDASLREGNKRASISRVGNIVRRLAEIKACENIAGSIGRESIIVMDGTLECFTDPEKDGFERLYKAVDKNSVLLSALSKTSRILTDKGYSFSTLLQRISPYKSWLYYPVADINDENHRADVFMIKLHPRSERNFRLDIYKKNTLLHEEIIGMLASLSNDPVFPGYPYGLIEADRLARVSGKEAEDTRMMFMSVSGRFWEAIKQGEGPVNSHSILDSIG